MRVIVLMSVPKCVKSQFFQRACFPCFAAMCQFIDGIIPNLQTNRIKLHIKPAVRKTHTQIFYYYENS